NLMSKLNKSLVAGAVAVAFGVSAGLAQAGSKELVEKMYELGKINDAEYKELSEAAKPADNELIGKYKGGFKWQTADGSSKFQVAGRAQLDYYDYNHDLEEDTFGMRRVYLGVKAQIDDIWKLEVTYNPDANQLEYGYLDYAPSKAFTARFGAQKFYAGFEEGTSSRFVDFLERSVADGLQPGKQNGIQLFGEPVKNTFFYSLGYYNGEGVNADESGNNADGKDTMLALAMNGGSFLSDSKDLVAHIGYAVSSGNRNANNGAGGAIFTIDGEARGDDWGSLNLVAGPTEFNRDHQNVSLMFAKGPFKFQHEDTQVDFDSTAQNDTLKASYSSVTWLITGEHYAKSYSLKGMKAIKPNSPVTKSGGTGAWEVGYRTSTFDAQDASQAGNWSTATDLVKTTTLGLKFIPNEKVRFMVNSVKTKYNVPVVAAVGNEKAITFRAQVDF
ncbi:MAG: porin, partial [Betaproteobacteria bacterium]